MYRPDLAIGIESVRSEGRLNVLGVTYKKIESWGSLDHDDQNRSHLDNCPPIHLVAQLQNLKFALKELPCVPNFSICVPKNNQKGLHPVADGARTPRGLVG